MTTDQMIQLVTDRLAGDGLLRPAPNVLATTGLPPETSRFLEAAGLPIRDWFGHDYEPVRHLPTINQFAAVEGYPLLDDARGNAPCLADNYGIVLGIIPPTGCVVAIDLHRQHADLFVNSSVEQLGACLAACVPIAPPGDGRTPSEVASELRFALRQVDDASTDGFWEAVVETAELGIL